MDAQLAQRTRSDEPFASLLAADDGALRVHPEDLAQIVELLADALAPRLAEHVAALLAPESAATSSASNGAPTPEALLTVAEVVEARPGMTRSWVYANAAACGAIRKNPSARSPLWFRLADVDAELEKRRKRRDEVAVESSATRTRRVRGSRARKTPAGSPPAKLFPIVPRSR
jgi:hypothetical protein